MNIDKKINLDTPIELMESGTLCHAMNIKLSEDGTTIQNDNALKEILNTNSDIVGYIVTNKDIVLFDKTNTIKIYNIASNTITKTLSNNWEWCGGEVFGTYTYNGKQELILAISERNATKDVPLKVININENLIDEANKIYPKVPICNSMTSNIINGGTLKIGTYLFFIRYKINDITTNWFPVGKPLQLFDIDILKRKNKVVEHKIQASEINGESGYSTIFTFNIDDIYASTDIINKCFKLYLNYTEIFNYDTIELACIHNYNASQKAYIVGEYNLNKQTVIVVDKLKELYNTDDLLINTINIFNINTLCNYKNRLYVADFKEDDKNKYIKNINTKGIKISYIIKTDNITIDDIYDKLSSNSKVIAPCTCMQFYLHYVFEDGSFSDGLLIQAEDDIIEAYPNYINKNTNNRLHAFKNELNEDVFYTPAWYIDYLYFENIPKLEQAVGYFISYAEIENIFISECITTKVSNTERKCYYSEFNIIGGNVSPSKIILSNQLQITNITESKADTYTDNIYQTWKARFDIKSSEVIAPDSINNIGKEGYLKVIIDGQFDNDKLNIYILLDDYNIKSLYINKHKTLIAFGQIQLQFDGQDNTYTVNEFDNLPHYWTLNSIYKYETPTIIGDNDSNPINAETGKKIYTRSNSEGIINKPISYIQKITYPCASIYPLINKVINIAPERIVYNYNNYKNVNGNWTIESTYTKNNFILKPTYINSLFKLDPSFYSYTQKLYQNYDKDKIALTSKTIRRSDIISDESIELGWKNFRIENYKIITENKGDIKNIVSAGTFLLVHCEASLFAFNVDNVMQTKDKDVQLTMPDVFDVNYKEVFTAEQGYGGLQDNTSWIFNQFGYIFLDNNAKTIYRFDNGNLHILNKAINRLLKSNIEIYKYNSVKIGYDKDRNRFLFTFFADDNKFTLSYNIQIDDWISIHSYNDIKYYITTKDKLFHLNQDNKLLNYNDAQFNIYDTKETYFYNDNNASYIDVVFSADKNYIKVLNYITYIINKLPDDVFEKLTIQIYNDICITNEIDISTERKSIIEYKKPFFDFGKWNLNYFRNIAKNIHNEEIVNRLTGEINNISTSIKKGLDNALVTGKYFVIRFKFKNTTKEINIKDIHAYYQ